MFWPNPSNASEDKKLISTRIDQSHLIPAKTKNLFLICWPNPFHASADTKWISKCVDKTPLMPAKTQNVFLLLLTKPIKRRQHKMHLNMFWANSSHAIEPQNVSQHVLFKLIPCLREHNRYLTTCKWGHKMYLNMCCPNRPHASEYSKYVTTCVEQTHPMPGRHKMYLNLCLLNPSNAVRTQNTSLVLTCVDPKCLSTWVFQKLHPCQQEHKMHLKMYWSYPLNVLTQNASRHVLTKFIPWKPGHKM